MLTNVTVSRYVNLQWHSGNNENSNKRLHFVLHSKKQTQNTSTEKIKATDAQSKVK